MGAGPAGLMAAERLSAQGVVVHVFDAKPSVGRKFLMAGKGGMNLTHSEPFAPFVARYADSAAVLEPMLKAFGSEHVCEWAQGLGIDTFIGSSGRIFPKDMKAAPLLRAWLARLRAQGVVFHMRHRWMGWTSDEVCRFQTAGGDVHIRPQALLLALGGGSWARLGSDGAWLPWLAERSIAVAPLQSSNCGFEVAGLAQKDGAMQTGWTPFFQERYAGHAFKSVAIHFADSVGNVFDRQGEFVATQTGVEGSLVYAVSRLLREEINRTGKAVMHLDLLPALSAERVYAEVARPRGSRSLSTHLKTRLGLDGVKAAVLREVLSKEVMENPLELAQALKALPITLLATRPMDEAISTAGGVRWCAVDEGLMSKTVPGVFFAGEMLDWEAPTGGYLLTACMSTGVRAAQSIVQYLQRLA